MVTKSCNFGGRSGSISINAIASTFLASATLLRVTEMDMLLSVLTSSTHDSVNSVWGLPEFDDQSSATSYLGELCLLSAATSSRIGIK